MNLHQIDRLVASVPEAIDPRQRRRLGAYVDTARRCEARIQFLREELSRTLAAGEEAPAQDAAAPNRALVLACELETLERVQPRVDSWLKVFVGALADERAPETFGEGPA